MHSEDSYVLITPARNEAVFIEKTICSVISQTRLPLKWVIVNDGSTDSTAEIVQPYVKEHPFIELLSLPYQGGRDFAAKVRAINAGFQCLNGLRYQFLGNLDADISLGTSYYEHILEKFALDSSLGIAGGDRYDVYDGIEERVHRSLSSVMGAVQLFRSQCYEQIGGYLPLKGGAIDAVAEIMARMHGWKVQTFPEIKVLHHRRTGTATQNVLCARFNDGLNDYMIGYHPLFEGLRAAYRIKSKPFLVAGMCLIAGYFWAAMTGRKSQVPSQVVNYVRFEQMQRIRACLKISGFERGV